METLSQFLDDVCASRPDDEAIAYAPTAAVTQRLTWRQLHQASLDASSKLVGIGVGKGTRVGFLCPNRADWLPIAFGAFRLGAVLVPLSTLWKKDEIAYALNHAEVQSLITVPGFLKHDYLAALREIVPGLAACVPGELFDDQVPSLRRVILLGGESAPGTESWHDLPSAADPTFLQALGAEVVPADIATVFFTSGTTAQAKAVVHCHGALTVSARRLAPCFGITREDSWWGHMPLFWSGGFVLGALATMAGGGRLVLHESVSADGALELLGEERCTIMAGWHQGGPLLEHPGFRADRIHLRKGTYHVLAPRLMGPENSAIGVYGMSETATCVTAARWSDPEPTRAGTFGRPLDGMEVRIIDPETKELRPTGETGEIIVKGPTLMEGYLKVARERTFDAEGFFRTGDLGYFDEDGYLHFATRLKDVIKTSGVNVAAAEVEEALLRHPEVRASYVVGTADPVRGESIVAFVVPGDGFEVAADSLREFCRAHLASYKVPRFIYSIAEEQVPRTGTGKIDKGELRSRATQRVATTQTEATTA